jgi:NRPS condensation-like uncharacterized protein
LADHISGMVSQPFDLARDQLLRAELVEVAEGDAILVIAMHHIVGDQWSFDILARELADRYNAIRAGRDPDPAEPAFEYSHYAAWHRDWFHREREERELSYWLDRLAGLEPVTFSPDRLRPPQQSFRGARHRMPFDAEVIEGLRRLAAASGATLAMLLLAALKVLLNRHSGSMDIGIGVPIANRHHPGSEGLIGTLLNTLVVRADLRR